MPIVRLSEGVPSKWFSEFRRQWTNTHLIDIDSVEYCDGCKQILAFLEVTGSPGPKATTITKRVAEPHGVPVFLVRILQMDTEATLLGLEGPVVTVQQVHPRQLEPVRLEGDAIGEWLLDLHDHGCGRIPRGIKRC